MKHNFTNMDTETRANLNAMDKILRLGHEHDSYMVAVYDNGIREVYEFVAKVDAFHYFGKYFKRNNLSIVDAWKRNSTLWAKANDENVYVAVNCFF